MKKFKQITSLTLAAVIAALMGAGCSNGKGGGGSYTDAGGEITYPIDTDQSVSFMVKTDATQKPNDEQPLWQEFQKRTGIDIEWVTWTGDDSQIALTFASGNIPDIIDAYWYMQPGGARGYSSQGYVMEIKELIDKCMPNFKAFLDSNEDYTKQTISDDGKYYYVPWYREKDELLVYAGPIVRKDLLDKVGMEAPTTIDEWYAMLSAFKNQLGIEAPLTMQFKTLQMFLSGAYGITNDQEFLNDFRLDESGKVVYGPTQPLAKEAYKTMAKWYQEGLIDPNILAIDSDTITSKMTTGQAGASWAYLGGGIGNWTKNHDTSIEGYELMGVTPPVVNKGDKPMLGQSDFYENGVGQAITTKCKNPELAARLLDYFFSEEGKTLYNYGVEGTTYDLVDGKPKYKEGIIQKQTEENTLYFSYSGGKGVQLWDAYRQGLAYPKIQEAAAKAWGSTEVDKYRIPKISHTDEESDEISKVLSDVNTYKQEMISKFLLGNVDVETGFDEFVNTINSLGLDKLIKIKQDAVDRYNAR